MKMIQVLGTTSQLKWDGALIYRDMCVCAWSKSVHEEKELPYTGKKERRDEEGFIENRRGS